MRRLALLVALVLAAPAHAATERHGFVQFPRDEHAHVDGWDYWWGAADLVAESGNRYTLEIGHVSWWGAATSSYMIMPRQGPYAGQAVMTLEGPEEWGHPPGALTRVLADNSRYVPGLSERLKLSARDTRKGLKVIDSWTRTTLARPEYRLRIDQDDAKVHPAGTRVRFGADLRSLMRKRPLLAGGTGQWWYGIPENWKYPSRSYQYMQSAERLTGTFEFTQPDGSVLRERVVPERSRLLVVHEYDATPEDIPAGLAAAEATQLHARYLQYYNYDWPWELIYADLDNGGGLMLAVLNFSDTDEGFLRPATKHQAGFQVLATMQLPDGSSVALDNRDLRVEHLSRRFLEFLPGQGGALLSPYTQSWNFRMRYDGGRARNTDGEIVEVPPFDLGLTPALDETEPHADANGNRLTQRVPFDVAGSWNGCPVHGFGWSELLVNWHGQEERDPWWTGGALPRVPTACGPPDLEPPGTPQATAGAHSGPPALTNEGCTVTNPGQPLCRYTAKGFGGLGGGTGETGGWRVTIERPGRDRPIVVDGRPGFSIFPCGTIRKGDRVEVRATKPGTMLVAGNPGFCI